MARSKSKKTIVRQPPSHPHPGELPGMMDSRGHIMDSAEKAAQVEKWKRSGMCTQCGKVKTHTVFAMGMVRKPIPSIPGQVYKGKCLKCKSITQVQLELNEQCEGVFDMNNRATIDRGGGGEDNFQHGRRGAAHPPHIGRGRVGRGARKTEKMPYSELASHISEEQSAGTMSASHLNGTSNIDNQRPQYEGQAPSHRTGGRSHGDNQSNGTGDLSYQDFGRMPSSGTARSGMSGQRMEESYPPPPSRSGFPGQRMEESYPPPPSRSGMPGQRMEESYPQPHPHDRNNQGIMMGQGRPPYGGYHEGQHHHPQGGMMHGQGRPQFGGYDEVHLQHGMMGYSGRPDQYGGAYHEGQHHHHHPHPDGGYGTRDYFHAQQQHQQQLNEQHAAAAAQPYPGAVAPITDVRVPHRDPRYGGLSDEISVISMDPSIMTTDSAGSNRSGSDKKNESERDLEKIVEEDDNQGERGSNDVTNDNGSGSGSGSGIGTSQRSKGASQGGGTEFDNPFSPSSPSRTFSNGSGSGIGSGTLGSSSLPGASRVGATSVEGGLGDRYNRLLNRKLAQNATKPPAQAAAPPPSPPAPHSADQTSGHVHFQDDDAHMTARRAQALRAQTMLGAEVMQLQRNAATSENSTANHVRSKSEGGSQEQVLGNQGHVRAKTHGDKTNSTMLYDKFEESRRAKIAEMEAGNNKQTKDDSPPKRSNSESSSSYSQKAEAINAIMSGQSSANNSSLNDSNSDILDSSAKNDSSIAKPGAQRVVDDSRYVTLLDRKMAGESVAGATAVTGKNSKILDRKLAGESSPGASAVTGNSTVLDRKLADSAKPRKRRITEEAMPESEARQLIGGTSDPRKLIDALKRNTHASQAVVLMALVKLRDSLVAGHALWDPKQDHSTSREWIAFPNAGWAKTLSTVMLAQASNAIVQSELLHTIWAILTLHPRYTSDLVDHADMKQIIDIMQKHVTEKQVQEYACGVLATVAANQKQALKLLGMYDGKFVQRLMAALYFQGEGGNVQVNALKALFRLSSASLASSADVTNAQPAEPFCQIMGRYVEDDPQVGDSSVNVVISVLHTMQRHSSNITLQIEGNRLLWNIFEPDTILDPDYVDILVGNILQHVEFALAAHHDSVGLHETAVCLLSKMSYFGSVSLKRDAFLRCAVETMKWQDSSAIVALHGCRCIANICARSPSFLTSQPVVDGIPVILSAMETFREHIIVQSEACAALTAICRNSPSNKERVHELEGIDRIIGAFDTYSMTPYDDHCTTTKVRAVVALTTLAVDPIVLSDMRDKGIMSKFEKLDEEDANLPSELRATVQDLLDLFDDEEGADRKLVFREGASEEETCDCLRANLRVVCTPEFTHNRIASLRSNTVDALRRFQGSAEVHEIGCKLLACLFDLASDEEANVQGEVDGQEELVALTRSLSQHRNNKMNAEAACSALQNYCILKDSLPSDSNRENDSTGGIESLSSLLSSSLAECVSTLMIYREDEQTLEHVTGALWALCAVREGLALTFEDDTTIGLIIEAMNQFPTSIDLHRHGIGLLGIYFSVSTSNRMMDYVNDDLITSIIRFIHEEVSHIDSEDLIDTAVNLILIITHKGFQAVTTLLRNEQLIDSIVSVLMNFPDSLSIQGAGIDILTNISLDNYLRADVCQRGGTKRIIWALDRLEGDSVVVCKAFAALANLISGADVEILRASDAPAPRILVKAMRAHPNHLPIQTAAAYALWALSARNDALKDDIVSQGGAEAVAEAMSRFVASKQMQAKGFVVLWSLAVPRHLKLRVGRCAIRPAVNGLSAHITSEKACEEALGCLKCFSTIPANKNMLEEAGAVDLIYSCMWLHSENSTVCKAALAALCNISVNVDTNQVSEITKDDLDAVVNAMRTHQQVKVVQESAIILLRNFTFSRTNLMVLEQNQFLVPLVGSAMSVHNDHFQGRADDLLRVLPAPNQ